MKEKLALLERVPEPAVIGRSRCFFVLIGASHTCGDLWIISSGEGGLPIHGGYIPLSQRML